MNYYAKPKNWLRVAGFVVLFIVLNSVCAFGGGIPSGYSEYYIPGNETYVRSIFNIITAATNDNQHTIITVTAWSKNTTVYYDHWENGYLFDPANPDANMVLNPGIPTANKVEKYVLTNKGDSHVFESGNIPSNPRTGSTMAYDGEDRIYVVGGSATVTRASWNEGTGTLLALAWDVYPVRPQLTTYINPFGEDLAITTGANLQDFQYVATLIQATANNTAVQVDLDHNGTYDTLYNVNRTTRPPTVGSAIGTTVTLNKGQTFILDRYSANGSLNTGAIVQANNTIQVQYGMGKPGSNYQTRGASSFPRGFWDTDYYAPVNGFATTPDGQVDVYLYNPWNSAIAITYQTASTTGTFNIPATSTVSFRTATGSYMPTGSGAYFHGSDAFWGISSIDTSGTDAAAGGQGRAHEWAYGLVPSILMENDHFMGWAPACYAYNAGAATDDPDANSRTDSGVWLSSAQDNVHVFVDYNHDGTVDQNYTLNRLQSQFMYNPNVPAAGLPGGMSNVEIYATGLFTMAYGQNPDTSPGGAPAMDLGYTALPGTTFVELVLGVHKSVSPSVIPTASGSSTTFTLEVDTGKYPVDNIVVGDTLPPNWTYNNGSTTITLADQTTKTDNPTITGNGTTIPYTLTWPAGVLGAMQPNQQIFITFAAHTTQAFGVGDISRNYVEASGTRTVGGVTQTFVTSDFAFVTYGDLSVTKTSSVPETTPLSPGDTYTYTVTVSNPAGAPPITGISVFDPLPSGIGFNSGTVAPAVTRTYSDTFTTQNYSNSNGTAAWTSSWVENNDDNSPSTGKMYIDTANTYLRFRGTSDTDTFYIERTVDLTGKTNRTLTFHYSENGSLENEDTMTVSINGQPVLNTSNDFTSGTYNNNVSLETIIANTGNPVVTIRFTAVGFAGNSERWQLDDIAFQFDKSTLSAPPSLISSSDGFGLAAGQSLTLTYSVTVDNPLPNGINQIVNTANVTTTEFPVPLTASATNIVSNSVTISANVGDRVWLDNNGNGMQDVGEPGLANMEVTLKDQFGTPVDTAITNSNGYYLFTNVTPKNGYYVQATGGLISGLTQSTDSRTDNRTNSFNLLQSANYRDEFTTQAYNRSDGSISWTASPWTETGDNNNAASGNIMITTTGTRELQINNNNAGGDNSVQRSVNMPVNAVSAIVSFNYRTTAGVDTPDSLILEISTDGGASWVTLNNYTGTAGATSGVGSFDIKNYATPNTIIRFRTNGASYTDTAANESFYVDNFDVTYTTLSTPSYLNADLGYKPNPGTATIGDTVWSDANANGLQDPGEPGLPGITLQLYYDVNGNGLIDDGQTPVTTVTGPDGRYLFAGVTANGTWDYIVKIDESTLSAYNRTTLKDAISVLDLAGGGAYMTADFGYQQKTSGTTFTIKDRVWLDNGQGGGTANDGNQNGTEPGIAGVTVALLDAGSNIIATMTTDSSGNFQFNGVPGGKNYTWQITDQAAVLAGYYGTTASALTGKFQLTGNLTANVDYTTATAPYIPNFGYNVSRAIGDTVFNDSGSGGGTINNGIQDGTEPGISGVTVKLYKDNGDSIFNSATDTLTGTLTTDAYGKYLFTGLSAGTYFVYIDNTQTVLSGFTLYSGHADPRTITLSGTNSNFAADFGYSAATQRKVSGVVWNDVNIDGSKTGESGIEGITLSLLNPSGTLIGTTATNASGYYEFAGLPPSVSPATYTVRVTDSNGLLTDYLTTFEVTEGFGAGSYNGQEAIDLSSTDKSNIDFGYVYPRSTRAVIGEFGAFNDGGKVVVRWQTVSEEGTIGFYLYRVDEKNGNEKRVNNKLLPGLLQSPTGGWYTYEDKTAKVDASYTYRLEEVEAGGNRISYGPWTVDTGAVISRADSNVNLVANDAMSGFKRGVKPVSLKTWERQAARLESRQNELNLQYSRRGVKAKISITEDGLYFLSAEDIAQVLSRNLDEVVNLIRSNKIRLSNKGKSVAVLSASDTIPGLYFYGEKIETLYTNENVYWLDVQKATQISETDGTPQQPAGDMQYFRQSVREEENLIPAADLFSDPKADFWMWDYVFPGFGREQVLLSISTPGIMDAGTATLTVSLQGGSEAFDGDDHHAVVRINGIIVGDTQWDGITASTVSFPVGTEILNDGANTVEISGIQESGVPYDIFYINYLTIDYPRHYTAADNRLAAESNGYDTVVIDGFTDPDIRVFDIADPLRPKLLSGVDIETAENNADEYQVSFQSGNQAGFQSANRIDQKIVNKSVRYIAVAQDAIKSCVLVADQPSSLSARSNRGDYLIIASGDIVAAAQGLADYRASQKYKTMVVDVEDIYDEFTYGIKDAEAIRTFLQFAYSKWRTTPKYVLLAGEGSFDYRDYMGFGDSIIPPLLAVTPEGLFVTDNLYADVTGDDGVPEFSIGRIPVIDAEEFSNYTSKVIGYESAGGVWKSRAVLAADIPDTGGNFPASSEDVAGLFPADFLLDRIYLDEMPLTTARADFLADINEGRAFVNFFGHGGLTLIGNSNLFSSDNIAQLQNGDRLPMVTAMTCMAGNYGYPGLDSFSETIVTAENGGAVAMWAPTGSAFNHYSLQLCKGFYEAVFNPGAKRTKTKTMGDAIRSSQKGYAASGENLYYLNLYNLMGDPALVIK